MAFTKNDVARLLSWLQGTDSAYLLTFSGVNYQFPLSEEQILQDMQRCDMHMFKYCDGDTMVGYGQIFNIDFIDKSAVMGRLLLPKGLQGKGLGSCMIRAIMNYAKEHMGLRKLLLNVFDYNHQAIKCYR